MHPPREPPPTTATKKEIQLQGPRPTPLRISKESQKIKKPPIAPKPQHHAPPHHHAPPPQPLPTQPVIIYSVSPKPIHVDASNFMSIVQQLTGRDSSTSTSTATSSATTTTNPPQQPPSPAARMAAITSPRDRSSPRSRRSPTATAADQFQYEQLLQSLDMDMDAFDVGAQAQMPGILSPAPANLPPATTPGIFSPAVEGQTLFGFGDFVMSPLMGNNGANFLQSPSSMFFSVVSPTPSPGGDPFNFNLFYH